VHCRLRSYHWKNCPSYCLNYLLKYGLMMAYLKKSYCCRMNRY